MLQSPSPESKAISKSKTLLVIYGVMAILAIRGIAVVLAFGR